MIKEFFAGYIARHIIENNTTGYEVAGEEKHKYDDGTRAVVAPDIEIARAVLASVGVHKSIEELQEEVPI